MYVVALLTIYLIFSVGAVMAPLAVQWSEASGSYAPALIALCVFGLVACVLLLLTEPPAI